MQAVLSNLLAGLLFIHAVLGCCWHSTHVCALASPPEATSEHVCGHRHACCHHDQPAAPADPCECRVECQGICTFLPPQKTQLDLTQIVAPVEFLAVSPMIDAVADATTRGEQSCSHIPWQPPQRLHLMIQILLI